MSASLEDNAEAAASRTPPYVAYKTFQTLLEDLQTNGVPPQFDRSALSRFSGGAMAQLLMSLRSLSLLNDHAPTPRLHALVKAYGTADYKSQMKDALRAGYPFLAKMDLMSATPSMFADAFKTTGAKEEVLKKCRRFYLQAAADVGIPIGPRILNGRKAEPRNTNATHTAPRQKKVQQPRQQRVVTPAGSTPNGGEQTIQQQLVAKYPNFDPAWPDQIKSAWFEGFKNLMATADPKKDGGQ
jgi:hypothetical protein